MTGNRLFVVVSVVALALAACGDPGTAAQTDDNSPSTTAGGSGGVHIAASEHGDILVGPEGNALYVFTEDAEGVSACTGACLESWPALLASAGLSPELDQGMFGSITRDDGLEQMTVNGMPLYYFAADSGPGDTAGQGLNDSWFVVDPSGVKVGIESADTDDTIIDYDY